MARYRRAIRSDDWPVNRVLTPARRCRRLTEVSGSYSERLTDTGTAAFFAGATGRPELP